MAYVLGFWYADGYMRHDRSYRVAFFSNDYDHLAAIASTMGSSAPIRQAHKGIDCGVLYLHSKKLYFDLMSLGGVRRKSTRLNFPAMREEYMPDFLRGYFDGDGSVHYINYIATKNHKRYWNVRSNFTCGDISFISRVRDYLADNLGLYYKKVCSFGPHQFKLGYGQKDTVKLLHYLYYLGNPIALHRKEEYARFFS